MKQDSSPVLLRAHSFGIILQVSALKYSNDSALYAACLDVSVSDFQQVRDQECLDMFGVPVRLGLDWIGLKFQIFFLYSTLFHVGSDEAD